MNVSMMLRTLSMCSGTLASKSETQQLITIDLSAVIVVNGDRLTTWDQITHDGCWAQVVFFVAVLFLIDLNIFSSCVINTILTIHWLNCQEGVYGKFDFINIVHVNFSRQNFGFKARQWSVMAKLQRSKCPKIK